jgi:hypothetical protein
MAWSFDFEAVEREAKRLPQYVAGSIYLDGRPIEWGD